MKIIAHRIIFALLLLQVYACNNGTSSLAFSVDFNAVNIVNTPRVYLQKGAVDANTININIVIEGITSLYGADIRLNYDPEVVKWGGTYEAGTVLETSGTVSYLVDLLNNKEGTIYAVASLQGEAAPVSLDGVVITIPMKVVSAGESIVSLEGSKLYDNNLLQLTVNSWDGGTITSSN